MPRNLTIATGRSCTARTWGMTTLAFEELVDRLRKPERTAESVAEYATMTKDERQMAKEPRRLRRRHAEGRPEEAGQRHVALHAHTRRRQRHSGVR